MSFKNLEAWRGTFDIILVKNSGTIYKKDKFLYNATKLCIIFRGQLFISRSGKRILTLVYRVGELQSSTRGKITTTVH